MNATSRPLHFLHRTGQDIGEVFDDFARLRITVFREFPYLYEGTVAYEKTYVQTYAEAERALLFAAYDGDQMIGATTCLPLADETKDIRLPFQQAGYDLSRIFYFAESLLLPDYRGRGLGHRFFDEREAHAASFGAYDWTCFCAVLRAPDHPLRPADYRPLDAFWTKRGYRQRPALQSQFDWPDLGETVSTSKTMVYWLRPLF